MRERPPGDLGQRQSELCGPIRPRHRTRRLPPAECRWSVSGRLGPAALREQAEKEKHHIARLETSLGGQAGGSPQAAEPLREELGFHQQRLSRLVAEPHRRLSNGLGCLCFALVGVPVAMGRRSADVMSIFFICFLPILLLYYPLLMTGENLARQGVFPQGSVWLADGALLIVGAVLMWRSTRR